MGLIDVGFANDRQIKRRYDGFFGLGAGSFFIFRFVRILDYDFLHASAPTKLSNVATNITGSLIEIRLTPKLGPCFVRHVFMKLVGGLILKTGYDAFFS